MVRLHCPDCGYETLEDRSGLVIGGRGKGTATVKHWLECANCGYTEGLVKRLIPAIGSPTVDRLVRALVWLALTVNGLAVGAFLGSTFGRGWLAWVLVAIPVIFAWIVYQAAKRRLFGR